MPSTQPRGIKGQAFDFSSPSATWVYRSPVSTPPDDTSDPSPRGVRQPKQARSRRTRQSILDAAVICFETHGYDATTTAMIAAEAGAAVGSVYSYFSDKRGILLVLMDTTMREDAAELVIGLDPASWRGQNDPRVWARSLIDAIFHTTRLRPGLSRILWERSFKDPEVAKAFDAMGRASPTRSSPSSRPCRKRGCASRSAIRAWPHT